MKMIINDILRDIKKFLYYKTPFFIKEQCIRNMVDYPCENNSTMYLQHDKNIALLIPKYRISFLLISMDEKIEKSEGKLKENLIKTKKEIEKYLLDRYQDC